MKFNFEQFKGAGGKFSAYRITINKGGGFQVSPGFYFKNKVGEAKTVGVFYDKDNRAIGFRFYPDEQEGAFKIIHRGKSATIAAKSFFSAYGMESKNFSGKYTPETVEDTAHGVLHVIELDKKLS